MSVLFLWKLYVYRYNYVAILISPCVRENGERVRTHIAHQPCALLTSVMVVGTIRGACIMYVQGLSFTSKQHGCTNAA